MASTVYDTVEIRLFSGKVIEARPLNLKKLREFMKKFQKMDTEGVRDDNDKALQVLIDCAAVAFKQYAPELTLTDLEEELDIHTLYKVIEIASGIKMGDDGGNVQAAGLPGTN